MLEYLKDKKGNLKAVLDFWIVNQAGALDDQGDRVFIRDVYVNPDHRNNGVISEFIYKVCERVPNMKWGYFQRSKYKNRLRIYSRAKWLRYAKKKEAANGKI